MPRPPAPHEWQLALLFCLNFSWGVANNLNDILVKEFTDTFDLSNAKASLVQSAFFTGYFLGALPAASLSKRHGFKRSIIVGLTLFSSGALLFLPASAFLADSAFMYPAFLGCLYLMAFGCAFLEASANPWVVLLSDRRQPGSGTAALNLAQAFNPMGCIAGIVAGRLLIFDDDEPEGASREELPPDVLATLRERDVARVGRTYAGLGALIAAVALAFVLTPFEEGTDGGDEAATSEVEATTKDDGRRGRGPSSLLRSVQRLLSMLRKPAYARGVVALFLYVGAQISVWSFAIRYTELELHVHETAGADVLLLSLLLYMGGRFLSTTLLRCGVPGGRVLLAFSSLAAVCCALTALGGAVGTASLVLTSLWMGPIFPTIFGLTISFLDADDAEVGAAGLVMGIVGGAAVPPITGLLSDVLSLRAARGCAAGAGA